MKKPVVVDNKKNSFQKFSWNQMMYKRKRMLFHSKGNEIAKRHLASKSCNKSEHLIKATTTKGEAS